MAYNVLASILRAMGDGKTPLHAMVVASAVNIGLDLLFVLVFHWGIGGAAAATLIAQACSSLYCLKSLLKVQILSFKKTDFHLEPYLCRKLMVLGLPMAFQNGIIAVGGMIVQSVVNGFGVLFIAGFTATNKLYGLLEIAATSYGYAMTTYVGQNLGAGKIRRIRQGMKSGLLFSHAHLGCDRGRDAGLRAGDSWMLHHGNTGRGCQDYGNRLPLSGDHERLSPYPLPSSRGSFIHPGDGDTVLPMLSGVVEFLMRTGAALLLPCCHGPGRDLLCGNFGLDRRGCGAGRQLFCENKRIERRRRVW